MKSVIRNRLLTSKKYKKYTILVFLLTLQTKVVRGELVWCLLCGLEEI